MSAARDTPTTIFVHVPKTAGTSVMAMLRQVHGRSAVWEMYGAPSDTLVEQFLTLPDDERARIRAVVGHVEFGMHRLVAGPVRYVTMLRDPIDRVVSHYHYTQSVRASESWAQQALDGVDSIDDYVAHSHQPPESPPLNNAHVRHLGGDLGGRKLPPTRHTLDRAKRNLEHFAVVGLQEHFDESVLLMRRTLEWGWPTLRQHKVAAERPQIASLDARTRDLIVEHNALDIELYEFARACFQRQLAAYGPELDTDLATLRDPGAATMSDGVTLSTVLMGYRNKSTIVAAARSLLDQVAPDSGTDRMEVIAVVSGDDRSAELLRAQVPGVCVVESPIRLLPGGARNLGLEHARGAIVAFLAGDCIARPGWAAARIAAHRAGHEVVAGAMDVGTGAGPLARAEFSLRFAARRAQGPAGPASSPQTHSLSFTRRVLNEIERPFRDDVRTGEDRDAAFHLYLNEIEVWFDPAIVIEHVGPTSFRSFVHDQRVQGKRESEWDARHGGFPRRWFDALPWLGVLVRAIKRLVAHGRSSVPSAWRESRGHRLRFLTAMPALLVGLVAREAGWTAEQLRSRSLRHSGGTPPA